MVPAIAAPALFIHVLAALIILSQRSSVASKIIIGGQLALIFILLGVIYYLFIQGATQPLLPQIQLNETASPSGETTSTWGPSSLGRVETSTSAIDNASENRGALSAETLSLTWNEISKHNSLSDCWIVVNGRVYDITRYIPMHPGGSGIIEPYCGRDATDIFYNVHSSAAISLLEKYYIGDVGGEASIHVYKHSASTQNISRGYYIKESRGEDESRYIYSSDYSRVKEVIRESFPNAEIVEIKYDEGYIEVKAVVDGELYEIKVDPLSEAIIDIEIED